MDRQKLLHALITWGAFDYASHAPQVRACNYYTQSCMVCNHIICIVYNTHQLLHQHSSFLMACPFLLQFIEKEVIVHNIIIILLKR